MIETKPLFNYSNILPKWVFTEKERPLWLRVVLAGIKILFQEPHHAIKIGTLSLFALKREFHWYGLNPKKLTQKQSEKPPILLLHGNLHSQGVWVPLAKAIQETGVDNPIYTVNLNQNSISHSDFEIVDQKIEEIKRQYLEHGKENVQVYLIGYSRGAPIAYLSGVEKKDRIMLDEIRYDHLPDLNCFRSDIGKMILLGGVASPRNVGQLGFWKRKFELNVYEIVGSTDFLETESSILPEERRFAANCGHLGLPLSPEVHKKIIEWIKP